MSALERSEVVIPEVLDAAPRSGMVPLVPSMECSPVRCTYCAMHGCVSFHDVSNCDEDFGDRWGE